MRVKPTNTWEQRVKPTNTWIKWRKPDNLWSSNIKPWLTSFNPWIYVNIITTTPFTSNRYDAYVTDLNWNFILDLNWNQITWIGWVITNKLNTTWI